MVHCRYVLCYLTISPVLYARRCRVSPSRHRGLRPENGMSPHRYLLTSTFHTDPLTAFVSVCDNVGAVAGLTLCCNAGRKPGACCTNRTEVFTLGQPFSSVLAGPATATESEPVTATSSGTRTYLLLKTVTPAQVHSVSTQDPAPTTPSTSAAPIAPPATQRNGPNIGAIVGGALAGALLGISLTAMFCLRRRRRRKIPTIRIIRDSQHELPSDDPTFRPNSKLFPAELHPEVSQSSLVPAELEITELKASSSPADLSTSDAAPGPFELHGREIDAIKVPSPPPSPPESKGGAPRTSSHYSRDAGWDAMASVDDANEPKSVRRPKMRSRPESRSGPWQDSYEKHGFF